MVFSPSLSSLQPVQTLNEYEARPVRRVVTPSPAATAPTWHADARIWRGGEFLDRHTYRILLLPRIS